MLYRLGTGLPFAARLGAGIDSELRQFDALLDDLPDRTLLLADAGFPHFDLVSRLDDAGHAFVMRVGADRTLLAELTGPDGSEHADGRLGSGRAARVRTGGSGPVSKFGFGRRRSAIARRCRCGRSRSKRTGPTCRTGIC